MKYFKYICACIGILTAHSFFAFTNGKSAFVQRGQETDLVRRFENNSMQKVDEYSCYTFRLIPEYMRSFRSCRIAKHFFGSNTLGFSGSRVENRCSKNILADYFGLPSDFISRVYFKPKIQDFVLDGGIRLNMDFITQGLYVQFWTPLVHTRWDMCMSENVSVPGSNFHPAGYLSGDNIRLERNQLPKDVKSVFAGGTTFGDMQDPLRYGKIGCKQKRTAIANVKAQFGWDFTKKDDYQFGGYAVVVAPTGNKRTAQYLFEPIIGNDNHWELGIGLNGRWDCWKNKEETKSVSLFGEAQVSHMFASWQKRSYDFKTNGRGSRYMLITKLDALRDNILEVPAGTVPELQYTGHLFHAINKTTLDSKIKVGVQADIMLGLTYATDAWSFDFGYNFWARSAEKLSCRQKFQDGMFAAKGDAQLYGYFASGGKQVGVALNGTNSNATVRAGNGNTDFTNSNVDNAVIARETATPSNLTAPTALDAIDLSGISPQPVNGSSEPVLLSDSDIDFCSALQSRAISNSFFIRSFYDWKEKEEWTPHVGFGLKVEFGNKCSAISQFGVWLELGCSC
ncbi:hypothetical protein KAH94_03090 [bacterium]|nr:hypothetical protein [bacterium]